MRLSVSESPCHSAATSGAMGLLIRYTGEEEEVVPASKRNGFSAIEFYSLLGCSSVQEVELPEGLTMVFDELGKRRADASKRMNPKATEHLQRAGGSDGDWISGDVVICKDRNFKLF